MITTTTYVRNKLPKEPDCIYFKTIKKHTVVNAGEYVKETYDRQCMLHDKKCNWGPRKGCPSGEFIPAYLTAKTFSGSSKECYRVANNMYVLWYFG